MSNRHNIKMLPTLVQYTNLITTYLTDLIIKKQYFNILEIIVFLYYNLFQFQIEL